MYTTISPKVRVLINLICLFAHDHSTKVRGHSHSLIYNCPSCANISFAIFMADTAFVIFLFQVVLFLRFVWANSRQYYRYIFRTLYSWWHCSYISYAMSMAIWSLSHIDVKYATEIYDTSYNTTRVSWAGNFRTIV